VGVDDLSRKVRVDDSPLTDSSWPDFGLGALAIDDRLRLFAWASGEGRHRYLWILRAFDRARQAYHVRLTVADVAAGLAALAEMHPRPLHVVTEEPDLAQAKEILERAMASDRVDRPAVVRRQELAADDRARPRDLRTEWEAVHRAMIEAAGVAVPLDDHLWEAEALLHIAQGLRRVQGQIAEAGPFARRRLAAPLRDATQAVDQARADRDETAREAGPATAALERAQTRFEVLDREMQQELLRTRLDGVGQKPPMRQEPGLSLGR
jgi:hypothetical protein